jgi:hypothetical protein
MIVIKNKECTLLIDKLDAMEEELGFLDELPDDADDYEVQTYEGEEDEGCEGGACKI